MKPLIPPDLQRCQGEHYVAQEPFRIGSPPSHWERCTNVPHHVASELEPDEHERHGSMSVCDACLPYLRKSKIKFILTEVATWAQDAKGIIRALDPTY